mgnify:CR=1 FL=1
MLCSCWVTDRVLHGSFHFHPPTHPINITQWQNLSPDLTANATMMQCRIRITVWLEARLRNRPSQIFQNPLSLNLCHMEFLNETAAVIVTKSLVLKLGKHANYILIDDKGICCFVSVATDFPNLKFYFFICLRRVLKFWYERLCGPENNVIVTSLPSVGHCESRSDFSKL